MEYKYNLIIRLILSLLLVIFGAELFYFLLSGLIFYSSYFLLSNFNPIILESKIVINDLVLVFVPACVAASAYVLLSILILLTKNINLQNGFRIFLSGFFIITIVNVIRIYFLALILIKYGIELFNSLHLFFWDILSTLFVLFLWIYLTKYFKVKEIPIYSDFIYLKKRLRLK